MGKKLEQAIAVLNGAVGDHLARTGNGLATPMRWVRGGLPPAGAATSRAVVMVHGLMCTEDVWDFADGSGDYGTMLARDHGYTPLYLRYNSGLAISDSGAELARLLEELLDRYPAPLDELLLLGFSMGGLVARRACHVAAEAGHRWPERVRTAIYVGTPHQGAPAERVGRVAARLLRAIPDPYTRLLADLGDLRSLGIKDLGDPHHPMPLPASMQHYLVAGMIAATPWLTALFGDGIVPCTSASNGIGMPRPGGPLPPEHVAFLPAVAHVGLAHHPEVYARIRAWCQA